MAWWAFSDLWFGPFQQKIFSTKWFSSGRSSNTKGFPHTSFGHRLERFGLVRNNWQVQCDGWGIHTRNVEPLAGGFGCTATWFSKSYLLHQQKFNRYSYESTQVQSSAVKMCVMYHYSFFLLYLLNSNKITNSFGNGFSSQHHVTNSLTCVNIANSYS